VEGRLDLINKLKRKYGGSLESLFLRREAIEAELSSMANIDDDIKRSESQLRDDYDRLADLGRRLSEERQGVAAHLAESVEKELEGLKMAGTRFGVHFFRVPCNTHASPWLCVDGNLMTETGIDQAVFMIAPNVGESLKPLASIASGG
jgi:DNA repair protein RecN (Recombination protein N)